MRRSTTSKIVLLRCSLLRKIDCTGVTFAALCGLLTGWQLPFPPSVFHRIISKRRLRTCLHTFYCTCRLLWVMQGFVFNDQHSTTVRMGCGQCIFPYTNSLAAIQWSELSAKNVICRFECEILLAEWSTAQSNHVKTIPAVRMFRFSHFPKT